MIEIKNISDNLPYIKFTELYQKAYKADQKNIEAALIASYSEKNNEVDARFVNLKFVDGKKFIFFSNYDSPKSQQFKSHNQITCVIYWSSINAQIRMKAKINKVSKKYSDDYFVKRDEKKNALAIVSNQSKKISSYKNFVKLYKKSLKDIDTKNRPNYWGGFYFIPYSFEFWRGHDSRLNERDIYEIKRGEWEHSVLQP